jgi:hypothetical protein
MDDPRRVAAFKEFESLGESTVQIAISNGEFKLTPLKEPFAREWIRLKEEARAVEAAARSEARADESLSISRNALEISRSSARRSLIAIALSAAMAIYEIIKWYSSK